MSKLYVNEIHPKTSGGEVKLPEVPMFSVGGRASATSLDAALSNFDYITQWTTTDVDKGGLLNSGGYAEIPTGEGGIYQISAFYLRGDHTDYNSLILIKYDGSSYTTIASAYSFNDYNNDTNGATFLMELNEGDRIYCGYDDRYAIPISNNYASKFSMMKIR